MRLFDYLQEKYKKNHIGGGIWDVSKCDIIEFTQGTEVIHDADQLRKKLAVSRTGRPLPAEQLEKKVAMTLEKSKAIQDFLDKHKEALHYAYAYDVDTMFLLSREPETYQGGQLGDGFEGHGTAAVLLDCPKKVLILGQND